jgi:hypothetical protein
MLVLVRIAHALYVLHCSNDLSLYTFRGVGIVRDGLPSSSAKNVTFCKLWYFCLTAKGRRAFFVLPRMRYAIVHPAIRVEVLLSSGYSGLCMEPLSSELEGNMCGRVARLCSGLATLLYHPDDTALALSSMPPDFRPQAMEDKTMWVTLVVGSPSRFYCVQHTCRHLKKSGVPNIYLLSTPGATELDQLNDDPKKRVMMFWYATVLPALLFLETHHGIKRAFVVEDTCLLAPGVTFQDVDEATWSLFKMSMRQHGQKGRIPRHASLYATSFSILACLVVCIPSQGHG